MKSYIYIITDGENYKIGKSDNVDKRLKNLSTSTVKQLSIIATYEVDKKDVLTIEKELHKKFKQYNVKNEWFNKNILNHLNEIKDIISQKNNLTPTKDKINDTPIQHDNTILKITNKLSTSLMAEKVRFIVTQCLLKGIDKESAKKYILDYFSSIYTDSFNYIFEQHFDNIYQDAVEQAELLLKQNN